MSLDTWVDLEAARTAELKRKSYSVIALTLPALITVELALFRVNSSDLLSWLAVAFIETMSISRFFHVRYSRQSSLDWQRTNAFLVVLIGIGWGTLIVRGILLSHNYPSLRLFVFLFGMGHVAVSTFSLALHKWAFRFFTWPEIIAMGTGFYFTADTVIDKLVGCAIFIIMALFGNFQRALIERGWTQTQMHTLELQSLIDSFPGGIVVVSNGKATRTNAYFKDLFGKGQRDGEPGKVLDQLLKSEDFSKCFKLFQSDPKQARTDFDAALTLTQGIRAYWFLLVKPRNNQTIIVGIDVQAKKDADAQIEAQRRKLETSAKLAALGEMAGGVAHEINNPIFVISSRVQLMSLSLQRSPEILHALKPHFDAILSTCDRVVRIVRGLKILSRGSESEVYETFSLRTTIDQTLDLSAPRLKQSGAKLELRLPPEDYLVEARPVQLSQVILNLLNNACDAVEGTESPWIRVETVWGENEVEISVSNSGPTIPPSIRSKMMEPFFTTKPVGKGTGLGLSISLGIMRSHQGDLMLDESAPHTRFVVRFPRFHSEALGFSRDV